ncbi:MAG: ParB/RepB/Spo0J family partition protein [Solobacterium sp.]|nr:ParB/RepB/Spo0J family partition protein [Solobacterium sp.]
MKNKGIGIFDFLDRDNTGRVVEIEKDKIRPSRYQPRLTFDEGAMEELTASIRANGLIQPITVRETEEGYEIIAGERRFRACVRAGYEKVPCYILSPDESQAAEMALVENIQREDLTAVEEAKSYVMIMRQNKMTQEQVAERVGKSQSAVANKIRLLNLPQEIQDGVSERIISERHARALLSASPEKQISMYHHIVDKGLNVRQAEEYIGKGGEKGRKKQKTKGFTRNVQIAVNSVNQCIKMIQKMGIDAKSEIQDSDTDTRIIIRIPK